MTSLGSASVVTDASGVTVGEQRYYPYGEMRFTSGTIYTDKLFTGQREMAGLGIYHYQARFYSPKLGRFLSADTIVPGMSNPQNLNRYMYVLGNPVKYTDPTGHLICLDGVQCYDGGSTLPILIGGSSTSNNGGGSGGSNNCNGPNPSVVCLPTSESMPELEDMLFTIPTNVPDIPSTISPLRYEYDFVGFWEFDRLDAWGFRLNGTGCFIIVCGDISLDLIGNPTSGEATLFITPGIHFGLGYGGDGSVGIVGAYDAPDNSSLAEGARNLSVNITPGLGGQGTYSVSASPNVTKNYAQVYSLSISGGGEASAVFGPSYSIPIDTCTKTQCYWGVK